MKSKYCLLELVAGTPVIKQLPGLGLGIRAGDVRSVADFLRLNQDLLLVDSSGLPPEQRHYKVAGDAVTTCRANRDFGDLVEDGDVVLGLALVGNTPVTVGHLDDLPCTVEAPLAAAFRGEYSQDGVARRLFLAVRREIAAPAKTSAAIEDVIPACLAMA